MATINELTTSISEMSRTDALALVLRLRDSRRTPKKPPSEAREKKGANPLAMFALLSSEQKETIIQILTERTGERQ